MKHAATVSHEERRTWAHARLVESMAALVRHPGDAVYRAVHTARRTEYDAAARAAAAERAEGNASQKASATARAKASATARAKAAAKARAKAYRATASCKGAP